MADDEPVDSVRWIESDGAWYRVITAPARFPTFAALYLTGDLVASLISGSLHAATDRPPYEVRVIRSARQWPLLRTPVVHRRQFPSMKEANDAARRTVANLDEGRGMSSGTH